jgi:hypothetical protein
VSKEEALQLMLDGEGLLMVGPPGTGKTHWLRNAVATLRQEGKRVDIVAKTHAAVQNINSGAHTADHWVRKHVRAGGVHCHTLVVEELTQVNVQLWADLALCRFKGVSFVCSGDFGQFQPICEHWSACPVKEGQLEHSAMLHEMCGGNRLVLTENQRSDEKLFEAYTNLGSDLQVALLRSMLKFPTTKRPAAYTLTMSHALRMQINRRRNEEEVVSHNRPVVTINEPPGYTRTRAGNQPQAMNVWPGLQLIGAGGRCLKGMFYTVVACDEAMVVLNTGVSLTHQQAFESLRLSYALTYASCQGLTLPGVVRLDTQSAHFTLKHLYVGLSRGTAANLVEVM